VCKAIKVMTDLRAQPVRKDPKVSKALKVTPPKRSKPFQFPDNPT
jgi:hypothetical protein